MGEVATNLRHVPSSFGRAVEVDDGVAILDQVRPDLVGDSPCCRSTRVARKLSVEVPSVREVPRFHAVAGEVHNGDDAQRAGEALGVEGLSLIRERIAQKVGASGGTGQFVAVNAANDRDARTRS